MSALDGNLANPYVGPRAFREGEPIFGRERETNSLFNLIVAERIVLLHSPSGAGKTSLIQAALVPRLQKKKFQAPPVVRLNLVPPEALRTDGALNRYVLSALLSLEEGLPPGDRVPLDRLVGMSLPAYLDSRPRPAVQPPIEVLIFDQFEEILILDPTDEEAKCEFFRQVGEALNSVQRWALFSMREDFIAALDPYRLLVPSRFSSTFRLDLLSREAAGQAIQKPAALAGVDFEESAALQLVDDLRRVRMQRPDGELDLALGPHVEPVQLQVVCYRLWESNRPDPLRITVADLSALGSVDGSLVDGSLAQYYAGQVARVAEETVERGSREPGIRERKIREFFDRQLITESGLRGTVLMAPQRSGGLDNHAIRRLIDAHLVRAEKRGGATWFELAHDRLVVPIRRDNTAWFKAHLNRLQQQADMWEADGRPESLLLTGTDLGAARRWAAANPDALLPVETEYLHASQALADRRRRARLLTRLIAILGLLSLTLAVLATLAYLQARAAREAALRQERSARAGQIAALAQAVREVYPQRSLLLALEALQTTSAAGVERPPAVEEALRAALKEPHGAALPGPGGPVIALASSPDGRFLAAGGEDGKVRLWEVSAEETAPAVLLPGGPGRVPGRIAALAFSPDGRFLAAGIEDGTARLWDLSAGTSGDPDILAGHSDEISTLAFSPDGQFLATGSLDTTVRLWDLAGRTSDAEPLILPGSESFIRLLQFSPDGRWLAAGGGDGLARLWDLNAFPLAAAPVILPGHTSQITALAFSPDGRRLAIGDRQGALLLWGLDVLTPAPTPISLGPHRGEVTSLAFSPDGRWLVSGGADGAARDWSLDSGDPTAGGHFLSNHSDRVNALAFSPDGRWLATASEDHTVRLHDWAGPAGSYRLQGHDESVSALVFLPDMRRLATGGRDGQVRLWDLSARRDDRSGLDAAEADPVVLAGPLEEALAVTSGDPGTPALFFDEGGLASLALSPDGRWLVVGSGDKSTHVWELPANRNASPFTLSPPGLSSLAFSPDGRWLAAGSRQDRVLLFDWSAGADPAARPPVDLPDPPEGAPVLAFSPDGRWLAAGGSDGAARLWELSASPAGPLVLPPHASEINALAFSSDGRFLATGGSDAAVRLWELGASGAPGEDPAALSAGATPVITLAFSGDRRWLAAGSADGGAWLWALPGSSGPASQPTRLPGHTGRIQTLAFSPDGRFLATGSFDETVRLWNLADLQADARLLLGHDDGAVDLAFSPDGRRLAALAADGTLHLWELDGDRLSGPVTLAGHAEEVARLAFTPDGRWLAAGSRDATARLWRLDLEELAGFACRSAGRNLFQEEWQQYFPGEPYRQTCEQWPAGN